MQETKSIAARAIDTIRGLAIDAIEEANSGHPGLPLGAAPMAYVLWHHFLAHNPADPRWPDRDRFVLSPGHGSMLLYALLHVAGYDLPLDELRRFRQWGSKTPGHPEAGVTPGVEATTGPLGQGAAVVVGMAIAERMLAARFNRDEHTIVDHDTYAIVSDGDLMEGISTEAASLAGHLGLGKLTLLYDANDVSLDGPTSLAFTEDVGARYAALGWHVSLVEDGDHDLAGIAKALDAAKADTERPSLLVIKTTIGFGSPNKGGLSASHGAPLGPDEALLTKRALGLDPKALFRVPHDVQEHFAEVAERGAAKQRAWEERIARYREAHPELAREYEDAIAGKLPEGWQEKLPSFEEGTSLATRSAGGKILARLADALPGLVGGDADLSCSTKTALEGGASFSREERAGRNIHFGVREHAMGAIANGIAYHGGLRPFTATFLAFSDYMRTPIRLAALDHLPVAFVFTHDSIGVGEDGPTHQPIEQTAALRLIPELDVIRPGDANETAAAWRFALEQDNRPTVLVLSRQNLPTLASSAARAGAGVARGGYVLEDMDGARAILIASGSELHLAAKAQSALAAEGVPTRLVSMPNPDRFLREDASYRDEVLPPSLDARVSIEAGRTVGWERFVGSRGIAIGVDAFGSSAPGSEVFERYGITAEKVVQAVRTLI